MKNKKGQIISIVAFFAIVLTIFLAGVLLMSFVNTILNPVQSTFNAIDNQSGRAVQNINNSFDRWWDWAVIILFAVNVLILFISSYMVDTAPIFLIVYIVAVLLLIIFGGNITGAMSDIWSPSGVFGTGNVTAGGNAISKMPMTSFFLNNFTVINLGIIVLSGIIMYAKFKYGRSQF